MDMQGLGDVMRKRGRCVMKRAGRTELAEAAFIVRALDPALFWVRVEALVAGGAVSVLGVPPALGHTAEVVLMQELACVALLAEAAQPVLADGCEPLPLAWVRRQLLWRLKVEGRRIRVPERAVGWAERAAGRGEGESAYLLICVA